jgi:hypothetical protein
VVGGFVKQSQGPKASEAIEQEYWNDIYGLRGLAVDEIAVCGCREGEI